MEDCVNTVKKEARATRESGLSSFVTLPLTISLAKGGRGKIFIQIKRVGGSEGKRTQEGGRTVFFKGRATNRIFSLLAALRDWRKHGGVRKGAKKSHKNEKNIYLSSQSSLPDLARGELPGDPPDRRGEDWGRAFAFEMAKKDAVKKNLGAVIGFRGVSSFI